MIATAFEGVIVGGGLVAASNFFLERVRGRRELRARFLNERREAYAAFLGVADQILRIHTSSLKAESHRQQWLARMSDLDTEVRAIIDDPQLVALLVDWTPDPNDHPVEGYRAAFELVGSRLSETQRNHFRALLEEASPLQGKIDALIASINDLGADLSSAGVALVQGHTLVELFAGSRVRTAADAFREAMTSTPTDHAAAVLAIGQVREAFVTAVRLDLGAPR